jgi:hypothetical protein
MAPALKKPDSTSKPTLPKTSQFRLQRSYLLAHDIELPFVIQPAFEKLQLQGITLHPLFPQLHLQCIPRRTQIRYFGPNVIPMLLGFLQLQLHDIPFCV